MSEEALSLTNFADKATKESIQEQETVEFPTIMFVVALIFDAIGMIPFVNIITEILAGFIFGFWQKSYSPKTNPLFTFLIAKLTDSISLGILPSNIGIVIYAYIKKKTAAKISAKL